MKKIYFVRHGETEWNLARKVCGATDSKLTERGHEQAKAAAQMIKDSGIEADEIVCSPLSRARETAQYIADATGLPLKVDDRLIERDYGFWEGGDWGSEEFQKAKMDFARFYETGESQLKVAQRIYNFLDEVKEDDKVYIVVCHNGIVRMANSYFYDMSNEEFAFFSAKNAEMKEYEFK